MKELGVIVPYYNTSNEIRVMLKDSLISQTAFNKTTIYLICDGSNDESEMKAIFQDYDNIIFLNTHTNQGPGHARNIGLQECKEEYAFFLDCDDCIEDKTLFQTIIDNLGLKLLPINFTVRAKFYITINVPFAKKYNIYYPELYKDEDIVFICLARDIAAKYGGSNPYKELIIDNNSIVYNKLSFKTQNHICAIPINNKVSAIMRLLSPICYNQWINEEVKELAFITLYYWFIGDSLMYLKKILPNNDYLQILQDANYIHQYCLNKEFNIIGNYSKERCEEILLAYMQLDNGYIPKKFFTILQNTYDFNLKL